MSESEHVSLGPGGEFDVIRRLLHRWGPRSAGAGDDAAVLDLPPGHRLVASVDTAIEDVHFRRAWMTPAEIGYRAVTAALSDLAAMGAAPLGVLTAFGLPDAWRGALDELADGIGQAVETAGTAVVGGNLSAAAELSITTTVLGQAATLLHRDAIRGGDHLYVTGRLGGPGAALSALLAGRDPAREHRARFVHPSARLAEGRWLAGAGATGAVDLSDGLAADAAHLAAAGGVGIELALESLPALDGVDPRQALASGEEYELLVSAPRPLDAAAFERTFGLPLTRVGQAVAAHPGEVWVLDRGHRVAGAPGHDHFQG